MKRLLALLPLLALTACADAGQAPAQPCQQPPVQCWFVQLDPYSGKTTRVCADPGSDVQPAAGWWRT
jgi:hypothetical protein